MTYRLIDTEIWSDPWFEDLDQTEKFLFIYLFTNKHCNQAGITEISKKRICFETGIPMEILQQSIDRLCESGKVASEGNLIACLSFGKHQARNGNFILALNACLDKQPESNLKATIRQRISNLKATPLKGRGQGQVKGQVKGQDEKENPPIPPGSFSGIENQSDRNELAKTLGKLQVSDAELIIWQELKKIGCTLKDVLEAKNYKGKNNLSYLKDVVCEFKDIRTKPTELAY